MAKDEKTLRFNIPITYTKKPVAGITLFGGGSARTEPTLDEMLDELERSDLRQVRKDQLLSKIKEKTGLGISTPPANAKRYLVDPQTGRIDVVENGEGEYTLKDAVVVSSSLRGDKGQLDGIANLLKVLRESETKTGEPQKKRDFYVDDESGVIVQDPEHGEFTLSEARAVSASKQRLLVPRNEPITLERLELLKRDIQDEMGKELKEIAQELRPKDDVSPFTFDEKGEMQLNPNARNVSALYYLLFQLIKQGKQNSPSYTAADGTTMRLPEWLEVKKWEKEEVRKDDRNKALMGLTQTIREHVGDFADAVRLTAAEVRTKGTATGEAPQSQVFECGQCKTRFTLPPGAELQEGQQLKCPSCGKTWNKSEVI